MTIPAKPKLIRLLDRFEHYSDAMERHVVSPDLADLGKDIHKDIESTALTMQAIAMIAAHGLTPWTARKVREWAHDLERIA